MIPAAEAAVQRQLTAWFIAADVEAVVLERPTKTSNGAGGFKKTFAPLAPQEMRLIPQGSGVERNLEDGRVVASTHVLMGNYGADMLRGDTFSLGGRDYEIVFINENREYEVKGEVILVG